MKVKQKAPFVAASIFLGTAIFAYLRGPQAFRLKQPGPEVNETLQKTIEPRHQLNFRSNVARPIGDEGEKRIVDRIAVYRSIRLNLTGNAGLYLASTLGHNPALIRELGQFLHDLPRHSEAGDPHALVRDPPEWVRHRMAAIDMLESIAQGDDLDGSVRLAIEELYHFVVDEGRSDLSLLERAIINSDRYDALVALTHVDDELASEALDSCRGHGYDELFARAFRVGRSGRGVLR